MSTTGLTVAAHDNGRVNVHVAVAVNVTDYVSVNVDECRPQVLTARS